MSIPDIEKYTRTGGTAYALPSYTGSTMQQVDVGAFHVFKTQFRVLVDNVVRSSKTGLSRIDESRAT